MKASKTLQGKLANHDDIPSALNRKFDRATHDDELSVERVQEETSRTAQVRLTAKLYFLSAFKIAAIKNNLTKRATRQATVTSGRTVSTRFLVFRSPFGEPLRLQLHRFVA